MARKLETRIMALEAAQLARKVRQEQGPPLEFADLLRAARERVIESIRNGTYQFDSGPLARGREMREILERARHGR